MAKLCDPDINMITLPGCTTPEPSIRFMIFHYYKSHGVGHRESEVLADQYISEQDRICQAARAEKV